MRDSSVSTHSLGKHSGPPIIWNTLYTQFQQAFSQAKALDPTGDPEELRRLCMQQYQTVLGGRVKQITAGGAPVSREVVEWLKQCFGCTVVESYGATEVGGM